MNRDMEEKGIIAVCGLPPELRRRPPELSSRTPARAPTYTITSNSFSITQLNVLLINCLYLYSDKYIDSHTKEKPNLPHHSAGLRGCSWMLLVRHVFYRETTN